jgi:signal transduction histidine kinase
MSTKAIARLSGELEGMYVAALEAYLEQQDESCLHRAYELGRRAVCEGRSILEMIELHQGAALAFTLRSASLRESSRVAEATAVFLQEAISPYEMTNRAYGEANRALERLNETLEAEVKRLALALHDDAGQLLAAAHIQLEDVARALPAEVRERLQKVRLVLDQIEDQLRALSHELRPRALEDQGLLPALEILRSTISRRTGLQITVEAADWQRLSAKIETALYRVIQEALKNVSKHAQACTARVRLWRGANLLFCSIEDDGRGFDYDAVSSAKNREGLGLLGIHERLQVLGGSCEIRSTPGKGTRLNVKIPWERYDADRSLAG